MTERDRQDEGGEAEGGVDTKKAERQSNAINFECFFFFYLES
jgi:hypothetical protein